MKTENIHFVWMVNHNGHEIRIHRDLSITDGEPYFFEIDGDGGNGSSYHDSAADAFEQAKFCVDNANGKTI